MLIQNGKELFVINSYNRERDKETRVLVHISELGSFIKYNKENSYLFNVTPYLMTRDESLL